MATLALLGRAAFAALPAAVQAPVLVPVFCEARRPAELDLFLPATGCVLELVRRSRFGSSPFAYEPHSSSVYNDSRC